MRRRAGFVALALVLCAPVVAQRLEAGQAARPFELKGPDGKPIRFEPGTASAEPGKVTVLLFVQPTQEASRIVLSEIQKLFEQEAALAKRVRAIAIANCGAESEDAKALAAQLKVRGTVHAALDPDRAIRGSYGVIAVPTTFIVAPDGTIQEAIAGRSAAFRKRMLSALRASLGIKPEEAPAIDPAAGKARRHLRLAVELLTQRRFDEAAGQLDDARKLEPDDAGLLVLSGEVRLLLNEPAVAEPHFKRALELAPKSKAARVGLVKAQALTTGGDEAEAALRKEIRRPHSDPALRYVLGRLLEERGLHEEAAKAYRAAFERSFLPAVERR